MPRFSSFSCARQELEEFWRLRVEQTYERYQTASVQYRRLLEERPEGFMFRKDDPLAQARYAESETLAEYARVLRIFTELTVNGTVPQEHSAMGVDGGAK
jgi:hypothetical protein